MVSKQKKKKGKYVDLCGSLLCRMASGKTFNVGSGLDDAQRGKPPAVRLSFLPFLRWSSSGCLPRAILN